jgi:hypothetical protein
VDVEFLHYAVELGAGDVVEISLDKRANVILLDPVNFSRYQKGEHFTYYGGHATRTVYHIPAPRAGSWHVVVDLGSQARSLQAGIHVIRPDR